MIGDGLFHLLTHICGRTFQLESILNLLDSFLCCVCKFCVPESVQKYAKTYKKNINITFRNFLIPFVEVLTPFLFFRGHSAA